MPVSASLWAASTAIRIASLDLCADEYLLMFARRDQIASVSRVVTDRDDSPLWRVARGLPINRGQMEDLIEQRPTLILTTGGGGKSTVAIAAKMGIQTVILPHASTIDDVAHNVAMVAALTGQTGRARRWQDRLDALRDSAPRPTDSAFLGQGGQTVSRDSLPARWMRLAGYRQLNVPGGRVTLESLILTPPGVLLKSDYRRVQMSRGQQWLGHPLLSRTSIRTVVTDGRPWTCAGPLMPYEIERLRRVE